MIAKSPRPALRGVLIALGAAFALSLAIITALSERPGEAVYYFFVGPFLSTYHAGNLLDTAALLMLTGLGATLAFRGGTFNLGGEGQSYLAALVASQVALLPLIEELASPMGIALVVAAAAGTGMCVAGLSGALRASLGIDELITSFLISSAILPIVDYAVGQPLRDADGYLLATERIAESVQLSRLLEPSVLNTGLFLALLVVAVSYVVLRHTVPGYEFRMTGVNAKFTAHAGIRTGWVLVLAMAVSGLLHGLAGGLYVVGTRHMCVQGGTAGLGWNGIAVALIAENRPQAVIPAALVFAYLGTATDTAILNTGFSFELSAVIQAAVFLLITVRRWGLA